MSSFLNDYELPNQSPGHQSPSIGPRSSDSPLLTLPGPFSEDYSAPFKAQASDKTSLTMKKRHHPRHGLSVDTNDVPPDSDGEDGESEGLGTISHVATRSKSFPCFQGQFRSQNEDKSTDAASKSASSQTYKRRWTLPIKASSTRETATFSPVFKHVSRRRRQRANHSPAIITLRRATNHLNQPTGITFFPPPRLNTSHTNLIDIFLQTVAGQGHQLQPSNSSQEDGIPHHYGLLPSKNISDPTAEAGGGTAANPAITQVAFTPTVSLPSTEFDSFRPRRCSTKYVTRSSIYEIIWDENDTPTTSSKPSSPPGLVSDAVTRRPSVAATYLEAQLCKTVAQSRRTSTPVPQYVTHRSASVSARKMSFGSMLDFSLSRLVNESALRNLPRSRASKGQMRSTLTLPPEGAKLSDTSETYDSHASRAVEVFPPLPQYCYPVDVTNSGLQLPLLPMETCGAGGEGPVLTSDSEETNAGIVGNRTRKRTKSATMGAISMLGGSVSPVHYDNADDSVPLLSKHS